MGYHPESAVVSPSAEASTPPRLLDQLRARCRVKHYSLRTERAYLYWSRRFILANSKRHPRELGALEVEAFLSHLATHDNVAASTQNQALNAVVFLYREVLSIELGDFTDFVRAKRSRRLPSIVTPVEPIN